MAARCKTAGGAARAFVTCRETRVGMRKRIARWLVSGLCVGWFICALLASHARVSLTWTDAARSWGIEIHPAGVLAKYKHSTARPSTTSAPESYPWFLAEPGWHVRHGEHVGFGWLPRYFTYGGLHAFILPLWLPFAGLCAVAAWLWFRPVVSRADRKARQRTPARGG